MKVTYYGHSCFGFEIKGKRLLIDPFITPNELAKDINVEEIEADYILLSHGHEDHVADAENIARRTGAMIISNFEIASWYEKKGFKCHPMNHGGKYIFDFGTVKYVQAIHSSVLPDGTYGGNPGGFVIWNDDICFYFAGDTALTLDMQLIPMNCPPLDFAILPIGDNFTMGVNEAIVASDFIQCDRVVGAHYDTFGYIVIDKEEAVASFKREEKQLVLLDIGTSVAFE
jgi:L-ascorbate metabolism protein UlaG (beta-lactamase superfamily)